MKSVAILITCLFLVPTCASAVVHTVTFENPATYEPIPLDLGVIFSNISDVHMSAVGYGGVQHGYWSSPGGGPFDLDFFLEVTLEDPAAAVFSYALPRQADYAVDGPVILAWDQPDWTFLGDGRSTLYVRFDDHFEFDYLHSYPTGFDPSTCTSLTISITADEVTPATTETWGTLKALFH